MKQTSIEAYEASREYAPTARWKVLEYLVSVQGWRTSEQIREAVNGSHNGTRPRLKELEDMGLVSARETGGKTVHQLHCVSYAATEDGRKVVEAGNAGRYILRAVSSTRASLERDRAAAMRAAKFEWDARVAMKSRIAAEELMERVL